MSTRARTTLLAAAATVALSACSTSAVPEPSATSAPAPTTTSAAPSTTSSAPEPSAGTTWNVAPTDEAPDGPTDRGPASAKPEDSKAAIAAARATMADFLAKSRSPQDWWAHVKPHLTPTAQDTWQYTQPRRLPDAKLTGTPSVQAISATDANVSVPTTGGAYQLTLVRSTGTGPWLVSAIEPPQGATR